MLVWSRWCKHLAEWRDWWCYCPPVSFSPSFYRPRHQRLCACAATCICPHAHQLVLEQLDREPILFLCRPIFKTSTTSRSLFWCPCPPGQRPSKKLYFPHVRWRRAAEGAESVYVYTLGQVTLETIEALCSSEALLLWPLVQFYLLLHHSWAPSNRSTLKTAN